MGLSILHTERSGAIGLLLLLVCRLDDKTEPQAYTKITESSAHRKQHGNRTVTASHFLTQLNYLLRETLLGLRRGGWMNWAAVSTVTVLLFLLGLSLQTSWQCDRWLQQFGNQLEVSVYLKSGTAAETVQPTIAKIPAVAAVRALDKEQVWRGLAKDLGLANLQEATQQLEGNPLVDELKVKAVSSQQVPQLAETLKQVPGVDAVQYVSDAVQQLTQLNRGFNQFSLVVVGLLTLSAIAVINITIRLIVMARRREIEVMQLVGATWNWIYLPFLIQGISLGILGALTAWALLQAVQQFLRSLLASQADVLSVLTEGWATQTATTPLQDIFVLPLILIGFGSGVGLMGSLFAVSRFAKR